MKAFTLLRINTEVFKKRSSKWIFTKTEVFENAVDQCERTKKTDKNKNAATATTKYFTHFSPNLMFNLKETKTCEIEYITLPVFPIKLLATIDFKAEINVKASAPM